MSNQYKSPESIQNTTKIIIASVVVIAIILSVFYMMSHSITSVVHEQLADIKRNELDKAYNMTSQEFQKATTFNDFKNYVNQYSVFNQNQSLIITDKKVENGIGYLSGTIVSEDGNEMKIEYQLVKESSGWKIQGMRLSPLDMLPGTDTKEVAKDDSGASIFKVLINDKADKDGYVQKDQTTIPKKALKIYATFYIVAPKAGIKLKTILVHVSDGAGIGPITGDITKSGNVMKAFTFTRTEKSWPTGKYEIRAMLSTGATKVASFTVE